MSENLLPPEPPGDKPEGDGKTPPADPLPVEEKAPPEASLPAPVKPSLEVKPPLEGKPQDEGRLAVDGKPVGEDDPAAADAKTSKNDYLQYAMKERSKLTEAAKKFKDGLQKYTPNPDFAWLDDRKETEEQVRELKKKQILLVRGVDSHWMDWAPLRLEMVLQTGINHLWPGCEGVFRPRIGVKLPFGFWRNLDRFDDPLVIVVPRAATTEYLQNFIRAEWEKVYYDLREMLAAVNVFLIVPIRENDDHAELLTQGKRQHRIPDLFGCWQVPVLKLELRKRRGLDGDILLQKIKEEFDITAENSRDLFATVQKEEETNDDQLLETIRQEIKIRNAETILLEEAFSAKTELKLRLIYTAAFFYELPYADFRKIAMFVLDGQTEEIRGVDGKLEKTVPLNEVWDRPMQLTRVIAECSITRKEIENISSVIFVQRIKYERLRRVLLRDSFIFFPLTEELINRNVLFDMSLSEKLQMALAQVIVLVIQTNYTTYNGNWLAAKAIDWVEKIYKNVPEELREGLEFREAFLGVSFGKWRLEPIEYLLKGLLLSGRKELIQIVKVFFEQLISSDRLKKKVALGLAVDLYRELSTEGNFPEHELDQYFQRSLEEGSLEDKYDAYRLLVVASQDPEGLYRKTKVWLAEDINKKHIWTRNFSKLYLLDYFTITFHEYFQDNDDKKVYQWLKTDKEDNYSDDLRAAIRDLSLDETLQCWMNLLVAYDYLFWNKCAQLERAITGIRWIIGRLAPGNNKTLTLAGDLIENLFFILSQERLKNGEKDVNAQMAAFARLVEEETEPKKLEELRAYWLRKGRQLYRDTIIYYKSEPTTTESAQKEMKEKLHLRSASVLLLARSIKSQQAIV